MKKAGYFHHWDIQPYAEPRYYCYRELTFSYSEHLRPACGAYTLSRWPAVLHSYSPSIPHFSLGTALHTISLHLFTSFLCMIWYER